MAAFHLIIYGRFWVITEEDGFPGIDPALEDLWTDDAWQFALPGIRGEPSGGWRVHGFLSENVFHIVWLDPCHRLDPDSGNSGGPA